MEVVDLVDVDVRFPPTGSVLELQVDVLASVDHQSVVFPGTRLEPFRAMGPLHVGPFEEIPWSPTFLISGRGHGHHVFRLERTVEHVQVSSVAGEHFGVVKILLYFFISKHFDSVAAWACNIKEPLYLANYLKKYSR